MYPAVLMYFISAAVILLASLALKADSHIACRAPALFQQCRVLRESPRGSRKYPNC